MRKTKSRVTREKLKFAKRGRRSSSKSGMKSGLYYNSKCGRYTLYRSDRLFGIEIKPVRWIAFLVTDDTDGRAGVISRHFSRKSAEAACERFDKSHTG